MKLIRFTIQTVKVISIRLFLEDFLWGPVLWRLFAWKFNMTVLLYRTR